MFFNRKFKKRSTVFVGVASGLAFLALAVWGWQVPPEKVGSFFLISFLFLMLIVIAAMILGLVLILFRKLTKNNLE